MVGVLGLSKERVGINIDVSQEEKSMDKRKNQDKNKKTAHKGQMTKNTKN